MASFPLIYVGILSAILHLLVCSLETYSLFLRVSVFWYYYWILFYWLSFLAHFWDIAIDCVQNYLLGPENSSEHSNAWLHTQREPGISDEKRSELKENVFIYCINRVVKGLYRVPTYIAHVYECKAANHDLIYKKKLSTLRIIMLSIWLHWIKPRVTSNHMLLISISCKFEWVSNYIKHI